ncbi:unnamed protein product [Adineta ricciae]|uniref:DUF5672 domain-containing protein n=1 Tax=Adineta ricciae TaxID=249248 RepID=A0A816EPE5_ADIRI|nr:unnamed protein product [Adineta ricciae]CAF1649265.1 unnamed protein product [Adineta ricciae]
MTRTYLSRRIVYIFINNNGSNYSFAADFYPHIAVLVEFRETDRIVSVVHNVLQHIPETWPIQIVHGKENVNFIRNSTLASFIATGKVFLTLVESIGDKRRINHFLTDLNFWKLVRGEKVLFFQIDSIMCSNSPHYITDYLQYDYVGAPWDLTGFLYNQTYRVGNGGFSLRSREKTLALLKMFPYNSFLPEDVWYAENFHRVNASIAPINIAKTFSVESMFYARPVGVHQFPWNCKFRRQLRETCPESIMVLPNGRC